MAAASGVIASLLVLAGVAKLRRPATAHRSIPRWVPVSNDLSVRILAGFEIALGTIVLALGGPIATVTMGLAYLGFGVISLRQRRVGASCGCFGDDSVPTTWLHVGFDFFAGLVAVTAAALAPLPFHRLAEGPAELLLTTVLVLAGAALCRLLLTELPHLETTRRSLRAMTS